MRRAVVDLTSLRPIWSIPPTSVSVIREAFGNGWEVVAVSEPTASDGDGAGGTAAAVQAAAGAEVYVGWGVSADVIRAAGEKLRWVHTAAAGVGGSITPELRSGGAVITNSRVVLGEPIADWVVAAIGFCASAFHVVVAAQNERRWAKAELTSLNTPVRELRDLNVGIVGAGGIGQAVAKRCRALGMYVSAIRRDPARRRPQGIRWVGGPGDLLEMARQSDVLVIAAPHTVETYRIVDESVLAMLPDGAYVINVARGALLDEDALLVHLNNGHLAGAVLDVFAKEPLAEDHPFWSHPRILVTPHVSGVSHRFWEREMELIVDNIGRYLQGKRLRNLVNLTTGY
ncbi:MAG: D-2-hydroxyacid dehydrogenase [Gemmatimonadota bacterium]|nr:MAG: D-2-hydroxyacid dehydrogenase [Gemmatimonadota bacterium]